MEILDTLQHIFSANTVILFLIFIAFGEKVKDIFALAKDSIKYNNLSSSDMMKQFHDKSKKLNHILDLYRDKYQAGRISYFAFHNGGHDFQGIPFMKFSCTDEATCKGVLSKMSEFQNYHLCIIVDWIYKFINNESVYCKVSDIDNNSIFTLMNCRNTFSFVLSPIWNDKNLAGFVMIEWLNEKYEYSNLNELLIDVIQLAKTIEIEKFK